MILVWTFVCEDCHAGWQAEEPFNPEDKKCRWCGEDGKVRGTYTRQSVEFPDEDRPCTPHCTHHSVRYHVNKVLRLHEENKAAVEV